MSLLVRLLTTGRSLVDLKNSTGQYRMRHKNPLPKFGGKKNPFAAATSAPVGESNQPAPVQVELLKPELTPAEVAAAKLKETVRLPKLTGPVVGGKSAPALEPATPAPTIVATPTTVAEVSKEPKSESGSGSWFKKLNSLAWLASRRARSKSAIPRFSHQPVQGELSLDNVKVVRNDLNEADVEVVPAKIVVNETTGAKPRAAVRTETVCPANPGTQAELVEVQTR